MFYQTSTQAITNSRSQDHFKQNLSPRQPSPTHATNTRLPSDVSHDPPPAMIERRFFPDSSVLGGFFHVPGAWQRPPPTPQASCPRSASRLPPPSTRPGPCGTAVDPAWTGPRWVEGNSKQALGRIHPTLGSWPISVSVRWARGGWSTGGVEYHRSPEDIWDVRSPRDN